jgi:hypothetical protein
METTIIVRQILLFTNVPNHFHILCDLIQRFLYKTVLFRYRVHKTSLAVFPINFLVTIGDGLVQELVAIITLG